MDQKYIFDETTIEYIYLSYTSCFFYAIEWKLDVLLSSDNVSIPSLLFLKIRDYGVQVSTN